MFIHWALTHPLDSQEIPRGTLSESLRIYYIHNSKKRGFPSWQNHNRFETMKWKRKGCYLEMRKKTVHSRESENIWHLRLYMFTRRRSTQWSRARLILEHLNSVCLKMWQWMNRSWNWDRLTYGYCKYLEMIFSSKKLREFRQRHLALVVSSSKHQCLEINSKWKSQRFSQILTSKKNAGHFYLSVWSSGGSSNNNINNNNSNKVNTSVPFTGLARVLWVS